MERPQGCGRQVLLWLARVVPRRRVDLGSCDHSGHRRHHAASLRGADLVFRPWLAWIGAAVFAVALWIFWSAHRELGRNFSPSLVVREQHTLVTGGIYSYMRHPMYTAFWLWVIAQALLLQNWVVAICGIVGWGILFFDRIGQEEAMMRETFGEQYDAFARRTKRLVPWIY